MSKYRIEIVVKTKECDKIQYGELPLDDSVIDKLFEKLQKTYEPYGESMKSIRFIKEEE